MKAWRRPLVCSASVASSVHLRQSAPLLRLPQRGMQYYTFIQGCVAFPSPYFFFPYYSICTDVSKPGCRRFLQKHLAQIKHILPEAVELEYVRSYDADTRSNKWELKISLLPMPADAEEPSQEGEGVAKKPRIETVQRRRAFHARLVKFASTHSEVGCVSVVRFLNGCRSCIMIVR
jgi:hypothetical protein